MYASVSDLRAEGVTESEASDSRLTACIEEAGRLIDRVCGWWFEPRSASFLLSGRGRRSLELPVPPVTITALTVDGDVRSVDTAALKIVGSPVGLSRSMVHVDGFGRGWDNVLVEGSFGVLENGATPSAVRRACMLLAIDRVVQLSSADADDLRNRWRVTQETTRDQSVTYQDRTDVDSSLTGNPDADLLLAVYRRPQQFGAA